MIGASPGRSGTTTAATSSRPSVDSADLQGVGGTFLAMFFIEKLSELPWKARHWPWIALGVGVGGYWAVRFASQYPQYFLGL